MKCAANLNQAQDVKRRLQPAIRWAPDRPVERRSTRTRASSRLRGASIRSSTTGAGAAPILDDFGPP